MANKSNKDFERRRYQAITSEDSEKSFRNGISQTENDQELKAFYAGVGYGKHKYKESLGFEHEDQRKAFERGVAARSRHLTVYKSRGFLSRLLGSVIKHRKKPNGERWKTEPPKKLVSGSSSNGPRLTRVSRKAEHGTRKLSRSRTVGTSGSASKTSTAKKRYRVKK